MGHPVHILKVSVELCPRPRWFLGDRDLPGPPRPFREPQVEARKTKAVNAAALEIQSRRVLDALDEVRELGNNRGDGTMFFWNRNQSLNCQ